MFRQYDLHFLNTHSTARHVKYHNPTNTNTQNIVKGNIFLQNNENKNLTGFRSNAKILKLSSTNNIEDSPDFSTLKHQFGKFSAKTLQ